MAILFKNNAASTLTYKMTDVQEVLYVADASVFPVIASDSGDVFKLTLVGDDTLEIVEAFEVYNPEGRQGFKIRRAQEGTTAQAWPAGTRVEMRITAGALQSFFSTIATTEKLGVSKLSTYQQAIEGTDNTTNMTPRRTVDAIHQFNTTIVETPVVTGTTSVRSGTTYPYTFTASVMGGFEDPIVAFYYVGNQTGEEAFIRVPVTTPTTTNATATGDVSFTGDVGDAPGGGACSAYGGYIAGGGGAGALGSLMEPAEWATPGWANDSYTHPANAGAGQVGCVLIISTWAL